jgi:Tol biopolymer transport system component
MRPRALVPVLMVAAMVAGWAAVTAAQTPFVPYYGKNNVHYDKFDWHIYTTDHFEIFYYPELEQHLERVAGYAESAYQQISADLKHDLSTKVQLILFKTHSEFEQENVDPQAGQEGVGAFAEPTQHRMVMPIDAPPDQLFGLIVHELTHQFEFDIIPQGLVRRNVPLWVNEGLSEYERGQWTPFDLMMVRDAAISDIVPKMTETEAYGNAGNARLVPYNLGHAVFEFIEAKYGKEGVRQFVFSLRKSVIGGGEDAYEEALKMKKDEFDQAFERYLKDRFKPFRDKERPADYGRDLAPNREKTKYIEAISITASPSGDLLAVMTFNRKDGEIDVILVSTKDGSIVRNLTDGFDKDLGFDHIIQNGERPEMPWMSWSPKGDRLAYFVRTSKERALLVQNVLTKKIEQRIPMTTVDEPESPSFSADGQTVAFSALRKAVGDIFTINLATKEVVNLTNDAFADFAPTYSPDGKYIIYNARVSGNQKLFRLDLDTKKKTQITFGTVDETDAKFIDDHTIVFSSTATDPNVPLEPEVAKNGNIYNLWTLDMKNGELRQYTDAVGGNWSAVVLNEGQTNRIAFVSYYKGDYTLHTLERKEPLHTAASSDFGSPAPIIDFQAPLQHTLVTDNMRRKKTFEKMFLEGRPPVNVGVTSQGDVFGGTAVTFGDVLGDKQVNFTAASIAQYRTFALSYISIGQRFQYALQGYSQTIFYYGQLGGLFYDPAYAPFISHDQAQSTQTIRGGSAIGIYPLDRYHRVEVSAGFMNIDQQFNDPSLQAYSNQFQLQTTGQSLVTNGSMVPLSVALVRETTVFREYGPLAGSTARISYEYAPGVGKQLLSRRTVDADLRHYLRIGSNGVFATRIRGFRSEGDFPGFMYFGGNADLRGYDYYQFLGQNVLYANAELRFPIIEAALTPIGVVGGVRGVFFAGIGGAWFSNQQQANPCNGVSNGFRFFNNNSALCQVTTGVKVDALGQPVFNTDPTTGLQSPALIYGTKQVSGFRLQDSRASYGLGLETFMLGFPIHFDWSWRTLFNKDWEDIVFACTSTAANGSCISGADDFRKPRFAVWIGYDF